MAQTLTLEQAADRLGLSPEEFKRRLRDEWKSVRSFRDGPTLRFRAADIEELARSLGEASDPGVPLKSSALPLTDSSEEIPITVPKSGVKKAPEPPLLTDDTDEDALAVPLDPTGSMKLKGPAKGDSDVRLDLTPSAKGASSKADVTEEISLELPAKGGSGVLKPPSSVKLSNPKSAKLTGPESAKIPGPGSVPTGDDGSSEFELSLDPDSDSFELTLNSDSSEEVALGAQAPDDRGGRSGIRLNQPADSGLSLEKKKKAPSDSDSDLDFELTLDAPGQASGVRLGGPKSGRKVATTDSDSEFELSLDDNSGVTDGLVDDLNSEPDKGDIFETDFELPVVEDESGSEVVAIESGDTDLENSDFDIAIVDSDAPMDDESASQVVLVDDDMMPIEDDMVVLSDDDVSPVAPSRKKRGLLNADDDVMLGEEDVEEGASASKALRGVKKGAADDDDTPIRTGPPPAARWGVLPALFLLPCLAVAVLGGLMTYEMLRGQWGYSQPAKPSDSLVRGVATNLGFKTTD